MRPRERKQRHLHQRLRPPVSALAFDAHGTSLGQRDLDAIAPAETLEQLFVLHRVNPALIVVRAVGDEQTLCIDILEDDDPLLLLHYVCVTGLSAAAIAS